MFFTLLVYSSQVKNLTKLQVETVVLKEHQFYLAAGFLRLGNVSRKHKICYIDWLYTKVN